MRWTQVALETRAPACGRRSRVVLTPRRWCQVGGRRFRRRRWQKSPVTGESAEETVKTIARGMPGETGVTVVTMLVCFILFCTRGCGCIERPAFPAPSLGENSSTTRAQSAPRERFHSSSPAYAGDPVFRDISDRIDNAAAYWILRFTPSLKLRRTGTEPGEASGVDGSRVKTA
jgi:hypothetical protein